MKLVWGVLVLEVDEGLGGVPTHMELSVNTKSSLNTVVTAAVLPVFTTVSMMMCYLVVCAAHGL